MTEWEIERTPYESEIDIVSDGRVIATVEAGDGQEKAAQILVAAPDMLEALEEVKSELDAYVAYVPTCPLCEGSAASGHKYNCLWHVVNAAIKKARG